MPNRPRRQLNKAGAEPEGRVRIIGGTFRSRVLRFPEVPGLRPTPDRVRETVFNWLREEISGSRCLDLFAGSGALGFEAASRGAAQVLMVDNQPDVAVSLRAQAAKLPAPQVEVMRDDSLRFMANTDRRFDVIFLDPPYAANLLEPALSLVERVARPGSLVYLEAPAPPGSLPRGLTLHRSGRAGRISFHLARYQPA